MSFPQHLAAKGRDDGAAAKPPEDEQLAHDGVGQAGGKGHCGGGKQPGVHGAPIGGCLRRNHAWTAAGRCRAAYSPLSTAPPVKGAPMSSPHWAAAASLGHRRRSRVCEPRVCPQRCAGHRTLPTWQRWNLWVSEHPLSGGLPRRSQLPLEVGRASCPVHSRPGSPQAVRSPRCRGASASSRRWDNHRRIAHRTRQSPGRSRRASTCSRAPPERRAEARPHRAASRRPPGWHRRRKQRQRHGRDEPGDRGRSGCRRSNAPAQGPRARCRDRSLPRARRANLRSGVGTRATCSASAWTREAHRPRTRSAGAKKSAGLMAAGGARRSTARCPASSTARGMAPM